MQGDSDLISSSSDRVQSVDRDICCMMLFTCMISGCAMMPTVEATTSPKARVMDSPGVSASASHTLQGPISSPPIR